MKKTLIFVTVFAAFALIFNLIRYWPDGKLHLTFCDVGQGDAIYIRFASGQDMLIDGGPDNKVLACLSQAMPFYDRTIDVVLLTHPQSDHLNGLIPVIERYSLKYFVAPPVGNTTLSYRRLIDVVASRSIAVKNLYSGSEMRFGQAKVKVVWPDGQWVAEKTKNQKCSIKNHLPNSLCIADAAGEQAVQEARGAVLGAETSEDLNHFSIITHLAYGDFDALFSGDSDIAVQKNILERGLALASSNNPIEVLKVPHHGSKTGLFAQFLDSLGAKLAVISVGANNRYGHPAAEILDLFKDRHIDLLRTDIDGTIEVTSDGKSWSVRVK